MSERAVAISVAYLILHNDRIFPTNGHANGYFQLARTRLQKFKNVRCVLLVDNRFGCFSCPNWQMRHFSSEDYCNINAGADSPSGSLRIFQVGCQFSSRL